MTQWPQQQLPDPEPTALARPLTAQEFLTEVQRVNCPTCWARPGLSCIGYEMSGDAFTPIITERVGTIQLVMYYHEARKRRAELKVGL
jgi:hypothetical protein